MDDKLNVERLRALDAAATPGPWEAKVWRHSGQPDTVCLKADAREIIGWTGFDGVPCTKAQIRANVKLIAHLRNAVPDILAMAEENARWSEAVATIMARCEALEDEAHDMMSKADCSKTTSFYSGQKMTAKSLRRELHDLTRALGKDNANAQG